MKRIGFTLIELMVVIAIIAILAAIIFPVVMRAKDAAYRSSDVSHLNELRSALQLYRVDQGAYPPQLLGYVQLYSSGANAGNTIPADQIQSYLYPKRVTAIDALRPAYDKSTTVDVTEAVWPNQDPMALGSDPQDGLPDNDQCARQAYGPTTVVTTNPNDSTSAPWKYYKISGYDVAPTTATGAVQPNEIHYALFWTGYGLGTASCVSGSGLAGSINDDPRQLGYNNPPDTTVVTWDSFFRDFGSNGAVLHEKRDYVLFLGGGVRNYDSVEVASKSWRLKS